MSRHASRKAPPRCPPAGKVLEVLIDYACAAKCPFCYNPPLTQEVLEKRLTLEQVGRLLLAKRGEGFDGVWFTGGEASQRDDLPQMLALARKLGYRRIQLGTNGLRAAGAGYARLLAEAGLNYARVSIHGASPAVHDGILGIPGAFERAVGSLDRFRAAEVAVGANFVVCRQNLQEIPAFAKAAAGAWGVDDIDILFPHYRGMMVQDAAAHVRYRDAVPWLERLARVLESAGRGLGRLRLVNFPPCAVPKALRGRVVDWKREQFDRHDLALPDKTKPLGEVKAGQKRQGPGCRSCRQAASCLGFEDDYARLFGDEEFVPLEAAA